MAAFASFGGGIRELDVRGFRQCEQFPAFFGSGLPASPGMADVEYVPLVPYAFAHDREFVSGAGVLPEIHFEFWTLAPNHALRPTPGALAVQRLGASRGCCCPIVRG